MFEPNLPRPTLPRNPKSLGYGKNQDSEWLNLALQAAQMSAYKWDLKTNLVTRTTNSSIHNGIQELSDSWMYDEGLKYIHSEDRDRVIAGVQEAIKNKTQFSLEFRVKLPNESPRWLLSKGHAIYGDHDIPLYILSVTQEITTKKVAELHIENQRRELEMKKSQLKIALDGAGMAVLTGINSSSKFISPELCKILGFENKDTVFDFDLVMSRIHPEDRARVMADVERSAREGGPIYDEHRVVIPGVGTRWLMIKGIAIMGEDGGRDFLIIQDITEQKKSQELLAQKERHLSVISNRMPQLAWIADQTGALTWVNERVIEYSGLPASELLGWGYLKIHRPDSLDKTLAKIRKHIEEGQPWEDTLPLLRHDKKWRWFLSRAEPIRDSQQKIVSWVGTNTDITEEREVAQNLERQKLVREEFSYTLTHDLRNPLGVISMCLQLALLERSKDDRYERYLHKAQETIQRMDKMIGELLTANLISAGQAIALEMGFFDLSRLIRQIADEFSMRFNCKIVLHLENECWGYWNEDGLRRVVENLLANAIKYGDQVADITVWLRHIQAEDQLKIEVHNYGLPIRAEDLVHIFEMHRRAGPGYNRASGSWGIGLTLVRGIVLAHKGSVTVTSEEVKGTSFRISLPVDSRPEA